jgi:hypothetical protein
VTPEPDVHAAAAAGYGRAADVYARARPSYPEAAVDWLLAELVARVRAILRRHGVRPDEFRYTTEAYVLRRCT